MMTKSSCLAAAMHGMPYFLHRNSSHFCEHRIKPVHRMVQLCNKDDTQHPCLYNLAIQSLWCQS